MPASDLDGSKDSTRIAARLGKYKASNADIYIYMDIYIYIYIYIMDIYIYIYIYILWIYIYIYYGYIYIYGYIGFLVGYQPRYISIISYNHKTNLFVANVTRDKKMITHGMDWG